MKKSSKLACLFSLGLLSGLFTIVSLNVTDGANAGIKINLSDFQGLETTTHRARLKTLYLWDGSKADDAAWMAATDNTLDIFKGLIVSKSLIDNNVNGDLIMVGGGISNDIIDSDGVHKSGIAGGHSNSISVDNAAIGGGGQNIVSGENGAVAGGFKNHSKGGVVLGGEENVAEGVILGGYKNEVGQNGLAMGTSARGGEGSFVRNDGSYVGETAVNNKAIIGAQNGVLIGTYDSKDGVSLVVNGPIQIGYTDQTPGVAGEIRSKEGCLYAFDGNSRHVLGGSSATSCTHYDVAKQCQFGRILLQEGNRVTAYSSVSAENCDAVKSDDVYCKGGELVAGSSKDYKFPSCINSSEYPYYLSEN